MTRQASLRLVTMVIGGVLGGAVPIVWAQRAADSQLLFELLNRMDRLEQEVRQIRGDLELHRHRQEEAMRRQQELYSDLERRLQRGDEEADVPIMPHAPSPSAPTPVPRPPDAPPGASSAEQVVYDRAFNMLREGRYEQAIAAFQDFLSDYPGSPLAGNAQYWLGETYYVTRDFAKAREVLLALGTHYPNHEKMPDALLRLGYIYQELNDRAKAREVLQQLLQIYPNSPAARLAEQRLQSIR